VLTLVGYTDRAIAELLGVSEEAITRVRRTRLHGMRGPIAPLAERHEAMKAALKAIAVKQRRIIQQDFA
jgi:hypothetical protein